MVEGLCKRSIAAFYSGLQCHHVATLVPKVLSEVGTYCKIKSLHEDRRNAKLPPPPRQLLRWRDTDRCTINNIMLAAQLCAAVSVERIESLT